MPLSRRRALLQEQCPFQGGGHCSLQAKAEDEDEDEDEEEEAEEQALQEQALTLAASCITGYRHTRFLDHDRAKPTRFAAAWLHGCFSGCFSHDVYYA
jgi:hypothetical protein